MATGVELSRIMLDGKIREESRIGLELTGTEGINPYKKFNSNSLSLIMCGIINRMTVRFSQPLTE